MIRFIKIAYLKIHEHPCNNDNFESVFKLRAPFTIRRSEGAGKLSSRMRVANNDGYEDKKIIGVFDFDKEGREQIHNLKREEFWYDDYYGDKKNGYYRKRMDHNCFFALLLPIPERLDKFASLDWDNFISYVEVENLLPDKFLLDNHFCQEKDFPAGKYLKVKSEKKNKIWESLFDLPTDDFKDFKVFYETIEKMFNDSIQGQ